ncbi:MAG: hypothetical protein CBC02_009260 [Flavobacteriaceae bacterium TMED42]|nr:MAG: hypothetical protein CBC02_009260 [Flavobacteriaceae bacterium TMED42]
MKKFFFLGFFLLHCYCFSQTDEEDAILDSLMDELFSTDSLMVDFSKANFLYTSFSFDESVFFAGRDFDVNQFGFTPSISYMRGQNFFLSLSSAYFSELNPKWDFVSISSGYSLFIDRKQQLSLTGIYSRVFFSDTAAELNPNRISTAFAFHKNRLRLRGTFGYLFGGSTSFYISTGGIYEFSILDNDKLEISLKPQLSLLMSQQTASEQIASGFFNTQTVERDVFDLINTQWSFPLGLDTGNWDFQLSYNINFPKALTSESDLSTSGYVSFSAGYFFAL